MVRTSPDDHFRGILKKPVPIFSPKMDKLIGGHLKKRMQSDARIDFVSA